MRLRKMLRVALVVGVLGVLAGCSGGAGQPDAGTSLSGDKKIGQRKGVKDSLGSKEIEGEKLPGNLEVGLALGSTVAMIACLKYL